MEDKFHLGIKALIRNSSGEILLLKVNVDRLREIKGYDGNAYWDIPGGRLQKGQSVEETLHREIEEETGITDIGKINHISTVLSNIRIPVEKDDVGLILSIYECNVLDIKQIQLSKEHVEAKWFPPHEASKLLEIKYPKEFTEKLNKL